MMIAPVINTGTFGVASQDSGAATATVGQQLGAWLLNTIFVIRSSRWKSPVARITVIR